MFAAEAGTKFRNLGRVQCVTRPEDLVEFLFATLEKRPAEAQSLGSSPRQSSWAVRTPSTTPIGLLAHLLRFDGWGGCQGGLTTEPEEMVGALGVLRTVLGTRVFGRAEDFWCRGCRCGLGWGCAVFFQNEDEPGCMLVSGHRRW